MNGPIILPSTNTFYKDMSALGNCSECITLKFTYDVGVMINDFKFL